MVRCLHLFQGMKGTSHGSWNQEKEPHPWKGTLESHEKKIVATSFHKPAPIIGVPGNPVESGPRERSVTREGEEWDTKKSPILMRAGALTREDRIRRFINWFFSKSLLPISYLGQIRPRKGEESTKKNLLASRVARKNERA